MQISETFNLSPDRAVEFFNSKGLQTSWNWFDVWEEQHAKAFTVAKAMKMDILDDIRNATRKALEQGLTRQQFRKLLESRLKAKGWWGRQKQTNPKTGKIETVQLGSPYRLRNIYQTNTQASMMAGRWKQFYSNKQNRPFIQYIAVMDPSTRKTHADQNKKIYSIDDPIWQKIWPPNGFNCRCRTRALTEKQAIQRGFKKGTKGKLSPDFPDSGFSHNHGIGQSANDIKTWNSYNKLRDLKNKPLANRIMRDHVDGLININYYANFVDRAKTRTRPIGETLTVGYLGYNNYDFMTKKQGILENGTIVMSDSLIVGAKAKVAARTGNALSDRDIKLLPFYMVRSKMVIWDEVEKTLLMIFKSRNNDRYIKATIRNGNFKADGITGNSLRSVFYQDSINQYFIDGRYEIIENGLKQ